MGNDKNHPFDDKAGEWEFPSGRELGALLRDKREKMGLTYAEIAEQTKLRPRFLEALEDEDWEHLPSPAFVKGFIRSYARVLELSEDGLVGLYQEITPQRKAPKSIKSPASKKKKGLIYLLPVFAGLALVFTFYNWIEKPGHREEITRHNSTGPAVETSTDTKKPRDVPDEKLEVPLKNLEPTTGLMEPKDESFQKEQSPVLETGDITSVGLPAEDPSKIEGQASAVATKSDTASVSDTAPPARTDKPELTLKAIVKERTWVRVTIDDKKTKEYIFDPKSTPEWKAQKGFELLIGNAGGIDLEFDGKKMEDLGKQGQVIKLKLPSELERSIPKD